jgi:TnpA family transposase
MVILVPVPSGWLVPFGYTLFGSRMLLKLYNVKKPHQKPKHQVLKGPAMQRETAPIQKRLRILSQTEIETLYGRPRFTPDEQIEYFTLSPAEKELLRELRAEHTQCYFILQLGYFKAKQMFFTFDFPEVQDDVQYILEQYFPHTQIDVLSAVNKRTHLRHRATILGLSQYRICDEEERQKLALKAQHAATVCSKPVYIFRQLLDYLGEQRIVVPGYSSMQDIIGNALTYEQNRLRAIVAEQLKDDDIIVLKALLDDSQGLYEITLLKREPKDFTLGEIKREIERGDQIRHLYYLGQRVLPLLAISNESIIYYASLVTYYSVFRLKQLDERMVYLYLLCFVYHRYQRLKDTLIKCLLAKVRAYIDEAKAAAKEQVYAYRLEANQNLEKAGHVLKLFTDDTLAEDVRFQTVQTIAFGILERQALARVADHMTTKIDCDETAFQWEHIDSLARQFKRHLRPLLLAVNFTAAQKCSPLMKAIDFLETAFHKGKPLTQYLAKQFPIQFVPGSTKRYLYEKETQSPKRLWPNRYEFLVYRQLRNGIESGDIFCRDSVRFRSFEDDLIDNQQWTQKEALIAATGLSILNQPIQAHLAELEQLLEERIVAVNQRISAGENEHIKITQHNHQRRWTLPYPGSKEPINHPFYDTLQQVEIGAVLHFVNQQCHFMAAFDHVIGRYTKPEPDNRILSACLVAWATNMGMGTMAEVSDIEYHTLATVSDNLIRLETLKEANDLVCNATAALPIFPYYELGDVIHSGSDGQKFDTRTHTINARYSPKYFGLKKGVAAYSMVASHIPINTQIIGANDHESHYVFDILFNNTTDIQPTIHSTDTHGANELNFAILHLFGYQFAPRYKDIYGTVNQLLYGFKHPSRYSALLLNPKRKISPQFIIDDWENVQRIMLSLALKTTSQNIIVSKLSAFPRTNKTKRALWEYDNIIRSLYLLDYIDSPPLRQNVQHALNRIESYHKLRRAVSYAHFGQLRFKTEYEQQVWNECSRLIANCIIYFNATILSQLLEHKQRKGDKQALDLFTRISPVAWQHINFHGRFTFRSQPENIDIDAIIRQLADLHFIP